MSDQLDRRDAQEQPTVGSTDKLSRVGPLLKQARQEALGKRALTQAKLAHALCVSLNTYANYECGNSLPKMPQLVYLRDHYYRGFPQSREIIHKAMKCLEQPIDGLLSSLFQERDYEAVSELVDERTAEAMDASYNGKPIVTYRNVLALWELVRKHDGAVKNPYTAMALAFALARIASQVGELRQADKVLNIARESWSDQVSDDLRFRLEYALSVNSIRQTGLSGVKAAMRYEQVLKICELRQPNACDGVLTLWDWIAHEATRSMFISLSRDVETESAWALRQLYESRKAWFNLEWYTRTRINTHLRVRAVIDEDHERVITDLNEAIKSALPEDRLFHVHSSVLLYARQRNSYSARECAKAGLDEAREKGFNFQADQIEATLLKLELSEPFPAPGRR